MDWDDFVHEDGHGRKDHERRCTGNEPEGDEHADIDGASHDCPRYDSQDCRLRYKLGPTRLRKAGVPTTAQAHFLPYLSATVGKHRVPITPPVWNSPFMVDIKSVPSARVARLKYSMKDG